MQTIDRITPDTTYSTAIIIRRLALGMVLLNLFVFALAGVLLSYSRTQHQNRALITTQNLVQVLEHDITNTFDKTDLALQTIVDEINRQHDSGRINGAILNALIARQQQRLQVADGLRVANASGDVIFGTGLEQGERPNVSDRDYFVALRDNPTAGLVISRPVTSRLNGKLMILIGRRITYPDQQFGGIVYAAMLLEHFKKVFASINLGPQGAVNLRDDKLGMIVRYPSASDTTENATYIGSHNVSSQLQEALRQAPLAGTFEAVTRLDGIERINAYRKLTPYPFYLIVGLATNDFLSEWRHEVSRTGAVILLFGAVSLFFFWLIRRSWQQQEITMHHLARQETKFRTLLDSTPDALVILNEQGTIALVNQQTEQMFGYLRAELYGQPADILLPARYRKDQAELAKHFSSQPERGEMNDGRDMLAITRAGKEFPITVSLSPIETEQGRMIAAAIRDVTERVKAQTRLTHLTRLYSVLSKANQAIIHCREMDMLLEEICRIAVEEGAFVMAWVGRLEGEQIVPMARWGRDDGYIEEALRIHEAQVESSGPISRSLRDGQYAICDDLDSDPRMAPWRDLALARGYRSSGGFPVQWRGKTIYLLSFYAPEPYFFSAEIRALLNDLCADITFALDAQHQTERRRNAEIELRQLNEELEWRVAERTRALEDANRELESFSYSVSHDLRAPLRSIDGFSQVLLRRYHDLLDDTGRDYLDRVRRASQRMGQLIDDLLSLSRVTRGTLQRQEVDLTLLARAVIDELQRAEPQRKVNVSLQDGMKVYGDPGLLRIVLDNLLGNAWKFSRPSQPAEIAFATDNRDGQNIYYVRDNGVGFDPAYAKKLFKAFQRLHGQEEFEGTGIGLATVLRIIRRHHGDVWAEAVPGEGATVYFTLPQRSEPRDIDDAGLTKRSDDSGSPERRGKTS